MSIGIALLTFSSPLPYPPNHFIPRACHHGFQGTCRATENMILDHFRTVAPWSFQVRFFSKICQRGATPLVGNAPIQMTITCSPFDLIATSTMSLYVIGMTRNGKMAGLNPVWQVTRAKRHWRKGGSIVLKVEGNLSSINMATSRLFIPYLPNAVLSWISDTEVRTGLNKVPEIEIPSILT